MLRCTRADATGVKVTRAPRVRRAHAMMRGRRRSCCGPLSITPPTRSRLLRRRRPPRWQRLVMLRQPCYHVCSHQHQHKMAGIPAAECVELMQVLVAWRATAAPCKLSLQPFLQRAALRGGGYQRSSAALSYDEERPRLRQVHDRRPAPVVRQAATVEDIGTLTDVDASSEHCRRTAVSAGIVPQATRL